MATSGQRRSYSGYVFLGLIFSLIMASSSLSYGEIEGDKELLRLIAQGFQANLDKITTWQGEAHINYFRTSESEEAKQYFNKRWMKHSAVFVYDGKLEATRWNWTCLEDRWEKDGQEKAGVSPYFKNCMLKDGALYEFGMITPSKMKRPYYLSIHSSERRPIGDFPHDFDPLYYFRCARGNVPEDLMWYYSMADNPDMVGTITREGNLVTFERTLTGLINRYQFDLSKGCNVVSFVSDDPSVKGSWSFEYEEINGVFVPKKAIYHNEAKVEGAAKPEVLHQEIEFTRNIINQPVDPAEFDLDKLGLQPGDIVQDTRANIRYIYKAEAVEVEKIGEEMVEEMAEGLPVEKSEATAAEKEEPALSAEAEPPVTAPAVAQTTPPSSKRTIYIITGLAALLLLLAAIILALRRKAMIRNRDE